MKKIDLDILKYGGWITFIKYIVYCCKRYGICNISIEGKKSVLTPHTGNK